MLFENYQEDKIEYKSVLPNDDYENDCVETMKVYDEFYYDKNYLLNCPDCNKIMFYVENESTHVCPNKEKSTIEIDESLIKDKSNKFVCKIDNIQNKCVIHQKEFQYDKDGNYYCSLCLREKKIKEYLNLDEIILSKEEIENFQQLILKSENVINKIKEKSDNFIKTLFENYDTFIKRNESLIDYCKGLLKFNQNYEKNFNLIGTIRRISLDIDLEEFKNSIDINDFYEKRNIIKFNNEFKYKSKETDKSYFESEKVIKNGEYYLGEEINSGGFGKVYKALSIKDKKIVAIKKLPILNQNMLEGYETESYILDEMKGCDHSIKFIESFKDNDYYYIVTESCDGNLRNILNDADNGLSIQTIKKIFAQLNAGLKDLKNKKFLHRDLKPDNILFNKIKYNNEIIDFKYKICDYGFTKELNDENKTYLTTYAGTPMYIAPEVKNYEYKDKSDIFSIGIILYELYYGNKGNKLTQEIILNNIKNGLKMKNNDDNLDEFNDLKNLIEECTKEEKNRIEWNNYFNHKFFNYEIELIIEIKEKDLNKNINLIGFDLFNNENTQLFINNKKQPFKKQYKFNKIGNYSIKLIFNNNIIKSSLEKMFYDCKNIKYINFNIFNTTRIKNMNNMFSNCFNLKEIVYLRLTHLMLKIWKECFLIVKV